MSSDASYAVDKYIERVKRLRSWQRHHDDVVSTANQLWKENQALERKLAKVATIPIIEEG